MDLLMPAVLVVCVVAAVQFLGLAGLVWVRMSERSSAQVIAQMGFYAMLVLVALTTAIMASLGSALWPVCAVTFGVMMLGATISSRREYEALV